MKEVKKDGKLSLKECRLPISYRIKKRRYKKAGKTEIRYYLQTIIQVVKDPKPCYGSGAIGIDINVDHLAVGIIDRFGNPIETFSVPFRPYEASSEQNSAAIGAIVHDLCDLAERKQIPLVIEKLDLSRLIAKLRYQHAKKTRKKLSALSYRKLIDSFQSITAKRKVKLLEVFAGYSSQLGAINYLHLKKKVSSHEAAAFVIARRGISKKDYLDRSKLNGDAPDGQVILSLLQGGLAGPKALRKLSPKINFKHFKDVYLQFDPDRRPGAELGFLRSHVFAPKARLAESA
ncbi:MAG: hypothetical protein ACOH5I_16900 [Oligoflexus sp.]